MASTSKDWANLPDLVFHMIFMKLFHHSVAIDSVQVGAVCKSWRAVILVSPLAITYQNNEKDAGSSYGWLAFSTGRAKSKIATVDIERKFKNKN
ncbi:hypothetical protein Leryth_027165 [Lithospermum erythrorhizon]|nr:hypothetical protein Leryth_027165 [Lithospermum erythrorhizon]